jgi:Uma2 family endonuclease
MSTATMSTAVTDPPAPAESPVRPAKCIVLEDGIEIPLGIRSLSDFREWARSDEFPERGRIDYIRGRIEVDLMVENLFYHNSPKSEVFGVLWLRNREQNLGRVFSDRARLSHPAADVSAEPDVLYTSFDSIKAGRVKFIPAKSDDPESFVEIEGSPDWVCEIVSDSSVRKDTLRLAEAYFAAGVREYWIVDARGEALRFTILHRGENAFVAADPDADGYQSSTVFARRYRFSRDRGPDGHWQHKLDEQ